MFWKAISWKYVWNGETYLHSHIDVWIKLFIFHARLKSWISKVSSHTGFKKNSVKIFQGKVPNFWKKSQLPVSIYWIQFNKHSREWIMSSNKRHLRVFTLRQSRCWVRYFLFTHLGEIEISRSFTAFFMNQFCCLHNAEWKFYFERNAN